MRNRIGKAAIDKAEARGREAGRDGIAVCTIGVEVQRAGTFNACFLEDLLAVLAHHDADRDHRPIARFDLDPLGHVEVGVIAARDFLCLERSERLRRNVIVIDRIGRHHALVGEAQHGLIVFGVVSQPSIIARLRKTDRLDFERRVVAADLHLIEAIEAPFGDEEALKQVEIGEVEFVRARDHSFPLTRRRQIGLGEAEVDVVVIGPDPQFTLTDVDAVFDTLLAGFDEGQFTSGVVG